MARRVSERQQYLNQEYRRLRSNLMARMRRQEKKGIKVDWSSLPRKPKKVTEASLRAYQQGHLEQQRTGEFKFKRGYRYTAKIQENLSHTTYDEGYHDYMVLIAQSRKEIEERIQAKLELGVSNEPVSVSPNSASYINRVRGLIQALPSSVGYRSMSNTWQTESFSGVKNNLLVLVDKAVDEAGVEHMEWYYSMKIEYISEECQIIMEASEEETIRASVSRLSDLVYPYTVTWSIWDEVWNG